MAPVCAAAVLLGSACSAVLPCAGAAPSSSELESESELEDCGFLAFLLPAALLPRLAFDVCLQAAAVTAGCALSLGSAIAVGLCEDLLCFTFDSVLSLSDDVLEGSDVPTLCFWASSVRLLGVRAALPTRLWAAFDTGSAACCPSFALAAGAFCSLGALPFFPSGTIPLFSSLLFLFLDFFLVSDPSLALSSLPDEHSGSCFSFLFSL